MKYGLAWVLITTKDDLGRNTLDFLKYCFDEQKIMDFIVEKYRTLEMAKSNKNKKAIKIFKEDEKEFCIIF